MCRAASPPTNQIVAFATINQRAADNAFALSPMDSRGKRENDGDIKSPSSQMALRAISIRRPAAVDSRRNLPSRRRGRE